MTNWFAIAISTLALIVSALTAWFTLLRKGDLRMTLPTVVFFGPDGGRRGEEKPRLKVFLRTLLYSISRRGQTVESLHVNVQRGESRQNFSIWVYGDDHFLLPEDGADFRLLQGQYTVRVYAKRVSDPEPRQLAQVTLNISESQARELRNED